MEKARFRMAAKPMAFATGIFLAFLVSQLGRFQTPKSELWFSHRLSQRLTSDSQIDSLCSELARSFQRGLLLSSQFQLNSLFQLINMMMFGIKRTNKWFLYFHIKICLQNHPIPIFARCTFEDFAWQLAL